jgi:hypothetical protein
MNHEERANVKQQIIAQIKSSSAYEFLDHHAYNLIDPILEREAGVKLQTEMNMAFENMALGLIRRIDESIRHRNNLRSIYDQVRIAREKELILKILELSKEFADMPVHR